MSSIRRKKRRNRGIIWVIILLLILNAAAVSWLVIRNNNKIRSETMYKCSAVKKMINSSIGEIRTIVDDECAYASAAVHIYSHRGGAVGIEDENSIPAYDYAISKGSINIEQDVFLSANGTLYVSHEQSAAKMTGVNRNYSQMTDNEIDSLRTFRGNHIAKLSEVFERYGDSVFYIVEIKENSSRAADEFIRLVNKYSLKKNIVVQSQYLNVLSIIESVFPEMEKLHVCLSQSAINAGINESYVDIIGADVRLMSVANCEMIHNAGKQYNVWTLKTESQIRAAIDVGADTYFADNTEMAFRVEREYRQHRSQ